MDIKVQYFRLLQVMHLLHHPAPDMHVEYLKLYLQEHKISMVPDGSHSNSNTLY